jgi:hypothetical protein
MAQRTNARPIDLQVATDTRVNLGWTVKPHDSEVFPMLAVKPNIQSPRAVCIAMMDDRSKSIILPGQWWLTLPRQTLTLFSWSPSPLATLFISLPST